MTFNEKSIDGVPLFELQGKIFSSTECRPVVDRIKEVIDMGKIHIMLDFSHVEYINSTGIGGMLTCIRKVKEKGGDLFFVALPKKTAYYFKITKLDTILGIYATAGEALSHIRTLKTHTDVAV